MIRLYDSSETLFYCDPPYIHDTRSDNKAYGYEMTDDEHCRLADALSTPLQGLVALSNYQCDLMDKLYPAPQVAEIRQSAAHEPCNKRGYPRRGAMDKLRSTGLLS